MMGNGSFRTTGLCKHSAQHNFNIACVLSRRNHPSINMDAPNERVEQHTAFCVFDLQINWP